ncbi:MAG: N-acetylmuramoyl-L-alanine amidase [bacterium]|nr:N-acetylmuramoyl-L-alanine amidase [bacterium]
MERKKNKFSLKALMGKSVSSRSWLTLFLAVALSYNFFHVDPAHGKSYCERLYESARRDYYSLLESERKQRFHDSWERVINSFDGIVDKYPRCSKAPDSLFNMGVLYQKLYHRSWLKSDLEMAQKSYERLVKSYPKSNLADDALFGTAQILEEMGRKSEAFKVYDKVRNDYPAGDMSGKAKKKLTELASYAPRPEPVKPAVSIPGKFKVSDVQHWSNPNYTRVVVYGSGQLNFQKNSLKRDPVTGKPPRIYIDIKGAVLPRGIDNSLAIRDGLLQQARIAQYDADTVRLVLDMESVKDSTATALSDPSRLVVDIYGEGQLTQGGDPGNTGSNSPGSEVLPLSQQLGLKVKRIVLDPGHGGRDPGAVGPKGLKEKDVVLSLAKRIKSALEARGYEVLMTRDSDVYVKLEDRAIFANNSRADLFVSIHTNASKNRAVRGIETYFLGVARDRQSSETAMLENAVSDENTLSDLEQILHSLINQNNMWHSNELAEAVQDSMHGRVSGKYGTIRNLGVKQAPFYVLSKTGMPAVLVETSFISNSSAEKLLQRSDFRDTLSDSITQGIINYTEKVSRQEGDVS